MMSSPQGGYGGVSCDPGEMEQHQDGWPFLEPVDRETFPEYFRVVKKTMDFQTMRTKLTDGR